MHRYLLYIATVALLTCSPFALADDASNITLTTPSGSNAVIVLPNDASEHNKASAQLLQTYLQKSTRQALTITTEPSGSLVNIHIGITQAVQQAGVTTDKLYQDAFAIRFLDPRNIAIVGGSDYGIEFGVYEFLERYLGVRWLMPGELGEHIPQHDTLTIPAKDVEQSPAFLERTLSGVESEGEQIKTWAYRNRMRGFRGRADGRFLPSSHTLGLLVHPAKYAKSHPEYYPLIDGKRSVPGPQSVVGWQPCFTAPGLVEQTAANIRQHFRSNPHHQAYSLGVNDNMGYCQCDNCLAANGGKTVNSLGKFYASGSYYSFVNKVVKLVREEFPDKRFGLIAYEGVFDPPADLVLDENVVPYITYDRMKWVDPQIESEQKAIQSEWAQHATNLGWYDYIYGRYYGIPRVYFHQFADTLRYGYDQGVRYYYAEAYPDAGWVEGPKFYVTLKLLWNPHQDVDTLLDEWYTAAVGQAAAPHLAAYYAHWEDFWTKRIPTGEWFNKDRDFIYLHFNDKDYLQQVTAADLSRCESLLRKVIASADTPAQQARAAYIYAGFQKYRVLLSSRLTFERMNKPAARWRVTNTVEQTGFDADMAGWWFWKNRSTASEMRWDTSAGRQAAGGLLVDKDPDRNKEAIGNDVVFLKPFKVTPGDVYRVSVWAKAVDLAPETGEVKLVVRFQDAAGKWVEFINLARSTSLADTSSSKWQKLTFVVQVPAGTDRPIGIMRCMLSVQNANAGQVMFDDFTLEQVAPAQ